MSLRLPFAVAACLIALPLRAAAPEDPRPEPSATPASEAPAPVEERIFSLSMVHSFTTIPKSLRGMEFWIPIPPDDGGQRVFNRLTHAPYAQDFLKDEETGNHYLHMTGGPRGGVPMQVSVGIDVQRSEVRRDAAVKALREESAADAPAVSPRWLPSEADPGMQDRVARIVKGRNTAPEKARAIFDWVIDTLDALDRPEMYPWAGSGKIETVLSEKRGSSIDLAEVFVALGRAAGIPARCVIGYRIPLGTARGRITRLDGWAEFHVFPAGWIPVDPAAADTDPSHRDDYFGRVDPWRITLSRGDAITLVPAQTGPPIRFLKGPYWEGDGEAMPPPDTTVEFTLIDAVPPPPSLPLAPTGSDPPTP